LRGQKARLGRYGLTYVFIAGICTGEIVVKQ